MALTLIACLMSPVRAKEPVGLYFTSEDLFILASYYQANRWESTFLPEGLEPLTEEEQDLLILSGKIGT